MTCWPPFSPAKEQGFIRQNLAFAILCALADILAVRLQKQSTQRYAAINISGSFVTSRLRRTSSNLAYITSVFIGYIGTDSIGSLIKRFAAKKAGVEDGRNQ